MVNEHDSSTTRWVNHMNRLSAHRRTRAAVGFGVSTPDTRQCNRFGRNTDLILYGTCTSASASSARPNRSAWMPTGIPESISLHRLTSLCSAPHRTACPPGMYLPIVRTTRLPLPYEHEYRFHPEGVSLTKVSNNPTLTPTLRACCYQVVRCMPHRGKACAAHHGVWFQHRLKEAICMP